MEENVDCISFHIVYDAGIDKSVRDYVDQLLSHERKKGSSPSMQLPTSMSKSHRRLSRDMRERAGSVHGIIRRTRSIHVDTSDPGMIDVRARYSSGDSPTIIDEVTVPTPAVDTTGFNSVDPVIFTQLTENEKATLNPADLVDLLQQTESLGEQAEIIHCLFLMK